MTNLFRAPLHQSAHRHSRLVRPCLNVQLSFSVSRTIYSGLDRLMDVAAIFCGAFQLIAHKAILSC
jgi:hypothetical protein